MSDSGGGDNSPKTVNCALGTEFDLEPGATEDVCVDLDGEWREDAAVTRHPALDIPGLELVSGSVGEGGDHVNITFKNSSDVKVTIDKDRLAITIREAGADASTDNNEKLSGKDSVVHEEKMDTEDSEEGSKEEPEAAGGEPIPETIEKPSEERAGREEAPGEDMEVDGGSGESACAKNGDNKTQSSEKQKANDTAFDSLFQDYSKEPSESSKVTDTTDDAPETAEMENQKPNEAKKMSSPILKMSFVDESVSTEKEKNSDMLGNGVDDKGDSDKMETESAVKKKEESKTSDEDLDKERNKQSLEHKDKDENSEEKKGSDETDKPTLKLASFSTMSTSTENGHSEENEDGCYSCSKLIPNLYEAIVWETMQFCDESCLSKYQAGMSKCASCNKDVQASSLGKYCVR